jgi:uncharacterized membrane protein
MAGQPEGGTMAIATEQTTRYRGSPGDRRVGTYRESRLQDRPADAEPGVDEKAERRARGLGWFSIGLGLAEIAAPRAVARLIGVNDDETTRNTLFVLGLREITSGIGILTQPRSGGWAWSRVGGDLMDLALLGKALNSGADRTRVAAATAAVLGVTVLDYVTSRQLSGSGSNGLEEGGGSPGIDVVEAITINRPRPEVYAFWHDFENFPRFMAHLESVQLIDERRSHWKARAPAGTTVEWDAETTEDRPNELIAWRALSDSDVPNSGQVRFRDAPGNRGTEVIVELQYEPPGGRIAALIAKLLGEEPGQQVKSDLRRLKQFLEVGEIVHSDASIHQGPHPARPPEDLSEVELLGTGDI